MNYIGVRVNSVGFSHQMPDCKLLNVNKDNGLHLLIDLSQYHLASVHIWHLSVWLTNDHCKELWYFNIEILGKSKREENLGWFEGKKIEYIDFKIRVNLIENFVLTHRFFQRRCGGGFANQTWWRNDNYHVRNYSVLAGEWTEGSPFHIFSH